MAKVMATDYKFDNFVTYAAGKYPDRPAVVFPEESVTYAELTTRIEDVARGLIALGVAPGDVVTTFMPNCIDHVTAIFAATRIGALCVPLNTRFRQRELSYVLKDSGAKVIITTLAGSEFSDLPARLSEVVPVDETERREFPHLAHMVMLGEGSRPGILDADQFQTLASTIDAAAVQKAARLVTPDLHAVMMYTSGTTANPKGVPLRHRQWTSIARQIGERLGARGGDRLWNALPMFHASALLPLLATFSVAGSFISHASPEPKLSIEMIQRERATLLWPAFTQIWQAIVAQPEFSPAAFSDVRAILCIGPGDTVRHLEAQLPTAPLLSCYGITEGSGVPTMVSWNDSPSVRQFTGGLPFEGIEAKVFDTFSGDVKAFHEVGELKIRGENVFDSYWNDPERTAEVLDDQGWFSTGDLAVGDEDGRISYQGRLKDMLKVGGENVAALEIEALLSTHPAVQTAAVVGAPDERLSEVPAAFVELKPGVNVTEDELREFCIGQLASFKVPRYVRLVTEWPMSATKIRKVDLATQIADEIARGNV